MEGGEGGVWREEKVHKRNLLSHAPRRPDSLPHANRLVPGMQRSDVGLVWRRLVHPKALRAR
eukprot:683640-Hanusia_phi.AAC.1